MNGDREGAERAFEERPRGGTEAFRALEPQADAPAEQPGAARPLELPVPADVASPAPDDLAPLLAEALPAPSELQLAQNAPPAGEPLMFPWFTAPLPPPPPPARIPHLGHLLLLVAFALMGLVVSTVLFFIGVHFHLFGVKSFEQAGAEIHYILGSEAVIYLVAFGLAIIVFPLFWQESLFAGLQWNGATALQLRWRLLGAAFACLVLATLSEKFMTSPVDSPIEKVFRTPGAGWWLFAFGVTFAPFFEEMFFRGFLLPAMCTAADWVAENINGDAPITMNASGRPRWPANATAIAAITFLSMPAVIFLAGYVRSRPIVSRLLLSSVDVLLIAYLIALLVLFCVLAIRATQISRSARPLDASGHPLWSVMSMVVASVFTSLPFAFMHAEQTGYSIGPFLLLVGVSLVLCGVRLATRSLAASTLVHASYNFILFLILVIGTGGFKHLDKM